MAEESAAVVEASDEVTEDKEDFVAESSDESDVMFFPPTNTNPLSGGLI